MSTRPVVRFMDRSTPPHISTLILIAGCSALSMSIFLPSLNVMADYFDTSYATMQLSVSAYLAVTAVLQIFIGPLSDRYGRRVIVLCALAIFVIASLGALTVTHVGWFLAFRMLQAASAVGIVLSRAIVRDMVPQEEAASMIGYVVMGMALIPMVGPMIGGTLDQFFGWQATFVFLALAGGYVWFQAYRDLGETVVGGGMGFAAQFAEYPSLISSPRFWGYAAAAAFGSGAFFALLGGGPFVAEEIFGLSPIMTGMALGAPAIGYAAGNGLSGRFSTTFGINRMAFWGTVVASVGMGLSLMLTLAGLSHPLLFFGLVTSLGLGNGIMLPNVNAGLLSVRPHLAGTASGLGGAIMIGGGAALSQLAGVILTDESGTLPLQWLMFVTSALAMVSVLYVMRRARAVSALA